MSFELRCWLIVFPYLSRHSSRLYQFELVKGDVMEFSSVTTVPADGIVRLMISSRPT